MVFYIISTLGDDEDLSTTTTSEIDEALKRGPHYDLVPYICKASLDVASK